MQIDNQIDLVAARQQAACLIFKLIVTLQQLRSR
jgi:hypothetical protein